MGKWMNAILNPVNGDETEVHIPPEDLVRLAEGKVDPTEREALLRHVNRCADCHETLKETLIDLSHEQDLRQPWWANKRLYALAASIVLMVLIGGHFFLQDPNSPPEMILASLTLDRDLRDALLAGGGGQWTKGDRVQQLSALLIRKGVQVERFKGVVLKEPYFQSKNLFGPEETLKIKIEDGVAYLEVVRER